MIKHNKQITFAAIILCLVVFQSICSNLVDLKTIWLLYVFLLLNLKKLATGNVMKIFGLYAIVTFIFILSSLIYVEYFSYLVGDLFNILWWTSFCLILSKLIINSDQWYFFLKRIGFILLTGGLFLSLLSIFKFIQFSKGIFWESLYVKEEGYYVGGTSLNTDYNIFSLNLFLCVLAGKYYIDNSLFKNKLFYYTALTPILIAATLSGSRRAIILLAATLFILFLEDFKANQRSVIVKSLIKPQRLIIILLLVFALANYEVVLSLVGIQVNSDMFGALTDRWGTLQTSGLDLRESYWGHGVNLYLSRNFINLIFGDGFSYMANFQDYFKTSSPDYPHNFLLSSLLYGGLFSTILLLGLIIHNFKSYLKNFAFFNFLTYWFFYCVFISLTSSNTIFSTRLNVVVLVMPMVFVQIKQLHAKTLKKQSITK